MQYTCNITEKDRALFVKNVYEIAANPKAIPFSFRINGEERKGFGRAAVTELCERISSDLVRRTFTATLKKEKLQITAETLEYLGHAVIEWVVNIKNVGKTNSPQISDLCAAKNLRLFAPKAKLHHNSGDAWPPENYRVGFETTVTPLTETPICSQPGGGRPLSEAFPYFRVECPTYGYNVAVGWAGQWKTAFSQQRATTLFTAAQAETDFYLKPGEEVRTPRIALQIYDGTTERGINMWRRFYINQVMPKWNGKPIPNILFMSNNGDGEEHTMANTQQQLKSINDCLRNNVDFDVWWVDAGWYKCYVKEVDRNVWTRTANWDCDEKRFPNEFQEQTKLLHDNGKKFLLWFEPERMCWWHMEGYMPAEYAWYKKAIDKDGKEHNEETALYKMGDEEARKWITEKYVSMMKRNRVDIYRQDFNMGPLEWWKENDEPRRRGILENHHVTGYLAFWDDMLNQMPGLLIDSCASGGRRNEYETMKRSVPFHYTDLSYGDHAVKEAYTYTMFSWIPYFRNFTCSWDYDDGNYYPDGVSGENAPKPMGNSDNYAFHTAFAPALSSQFTKEEDPDAAAPYYNKMHAIWRRAAKYTLSGDFYPLTPFSKSPDTWYCLQFHDEDKAEGVVSCVRNTPSPDESITLNLRQIDESAVYVFDDPEFGNSFTVTGKELAKNGFTVTLPARTGVYWFYKTKR